MLKIALTASLLFVATAVNAGWWEQRVNTDTKKFENACETLTEKEDVSYCKSRASLMSVPETASTRDWGHHQNALIEFARRYRTQFYMVVPPLGKTANK